MLKRVSLSITLLLLATLSFIRPAAAQDLPGGNTAADTPGLKVGYTRMYDLKKEETPTTTGITAPTLSNMMMVTALEFDSDSNAKDMLNKSSDELSKMNGQQGIEAKVDDAKDLGDGAKAFHVTMKSGDTNIVMESIAFRDDKTLFNVTVSLDDQGAAQKQAEEVAKFIKDKKNGGDVTVKEDGTSTGGVFDRFPTKDNTDITGGMVPSMDTEVKP